MLLYVKQKTAEMVDFTINEIEKIMNYKEDKIYKNDCNEQSLHIR